MDDGIKQKAGNKTEENLEENAEKRVEEATKEKVEWTIEIPADKKAIKEPTERELAKGSFWYTFLVVPWLTQLGVVLVVGAGYMLSSILQNLLYSVPVLLKALIALMGLAIVAVPFWLGMRRARKVPALGKTFASRYAPLVLPIIYALVLWCVVMMVWQGDFSSDVTKRITIFGFFPFIPGDALLASGGHYEYIILAAVAIYALFLCGFVFGVQRERKGEALPTVKNGIQASVAVLAVLVGIAAWQWSTYGEKLRTLQETLALAQAAEAQEVLLGTQGQQSTPPQATEQQGQQAAAESTPNAETQGAENPAPVVAPQPVPTPETAPASAHPVTTE